MRDKKALKIETLKDERDFLANTINVFVKHKDISTLTFQNEYGAISLSRRSEEKATKIVGFAVGGEEDIEDMDYVDDDEDDHYSDEGDKAKCRKRK
ncbi:MAG: hypothetical protein K2O35_03055 [Clostridia bacterium]|nr:hypothetical protein [Clostridia bacterium]